MSGVLANSFHAYAGGPDGSVHNPAFVTDSLSIILWGDGIGQFQWVHLKNPAVSTNTWKMLNYQNKLFFQEDTAGVGNVATLNGVGVLTTVGNHVITGNNSNRFFVVQTGGDLVTTANNKWRWAWGSNAVIETGGGTNSGSNFELKPLR